jgi:glycosyltransferase involved in cell wall biosynthesis
MVVLEAFAAGVPVIGSRLGGIAELVRDGVDGLLVEPANVMAWTETWRRVCTEADLLPRLRAGVRAPRTIEAVAGEMANLYDQLLTQARAVEVNSSVAVVP